MVNKKIAVALSLLPTGWIGIHHVYLGRKIRPLLYILFVWTTIPIILSLIDGIKLYRMSTEIFLQKYGSKSEQTSFYIRELEKSGVISKEKAEEMVRNNINSDEDFDVDEIVEKNEKEKEDSDSNNRSNVKNIEPDYSDYYGPWQNK